MNIELRFLEKAAKDGNYISFSYENQHLKKVKPLKLTFKEEHYYLHTPDAIFKFEHIKNIQISKEKF